MQSAGSNEIPSRAEEQEEEAREQTGVSEQEKREAEQEGREVQVRRKPDGPTDEEWRKHRVTHYPFRNWCPYCVAARAKSWPHVRSPIEDNREKLADICFDYCFLRDKPGGESVPVLVGRERHSRMTLAHVVPHKGSSVDWLIPQLQRDVRKFGIHGKFIIKSDQESSILDILRKLAEARGRLEQTLIEASPRGDHQSNGVAEKAVQEIEEAVRTQGWKNILRKTQAEEVSWGVS